MAEPEAEGTPPSSISTPDLWDLEASPTQLEQLADAWRSVEKKVSFAENKVDTVVQSVFSKEEWTGETADAFNSYRKRLIGDVELCASCAGNVASVLDRMAAILRTNQSLLDDERKRLSAVPVTETMNGLTFHPKNSEQSGLVTTAVTTAKEIRSRLDERLREQREDLDFYKDQFAALTKQWKPRTVRMLNLNVGQGAGNGWRDKGGTDPGDIPAMARLIADQNPDIVTLQEVFKKDISPDGKIDTVVDLKSELERITGDRWEVRFEEASKKYQASDSIPILGDYFHQPFGNAVLVREGDVVAGAGDGQKIKLDADGDKVTLPDGTRVDDGEGRSAARTEVRFNPR
ncbi:endonuclease/exonuclease/phosphatase family protein [Nonomuraea sp. NPDC003754]